MFKVPNEQDPYSAIGKYIRDHITVIEDIIAVIKINEVETNQLFVVDINEEDDFIWENDWWEGEENVTLIDFFPVSEAQRANQSVQSADTISRQAAIDAVHKDYDTILDFKSDGATIASSIEDILLALSSAQPEIIRCKDCKHKPVTDDNYDDDERDCGLNIEFPDYRCPCQCEDAYYNRLPDDDWFCGNAERREE